MAQREPRLEQRRAGGSDPVFLWPRGLRWWFILFAILFVVAIQHSRLADWRLSLAVAVWLIWIYPLLIFVGLRRRVLADLWGTWPPQLDAAYRDTPRLVTEPDTKYWRLFLALLPFGGRAYRPASGEDARTSLQRAALADYFASNPSGGGVWCDRGFLRWLATRCGPVVAGQATMFALLLLAAFQGFQKDLIILVLVWSGIAMLYLWRAACTFERECPLSLEDLFRLPYLTRTLENTYLVKRLPELTVPLVLTIAGINLPPIIPLVLKGAAGPAT